MGVRVGGRTCSGEVDHPALGFDHHPWIRSPARFGYARVTVDGRQQITRA
jgi:hypothetical protein